MPILSYLRFALTEDADVTVFERDLEAMRVLAASQPGHLWSAVARSTHEERVWVVASEWEEVEQVRAWEHHPEHEVLYDIWEPRYREPFVHRRFVPWVRPVEPAG